MSTPGGLLDRGRRAIEGPEGPPIAWTLRGYLPEQLSGDVVSGLTVAALIVPLSIGYAGVAGLPPEMGLYASLAPLVAYAVFGSARRLIVGPDASTAALIAATIAPLAATGDDRVRLASVLGLMVAAVFVAMRLGRMGFLADFLSRPILVGYLAGVGITVALGQVEKILGGPAIADAVAVLGRTDWSSADPAAVVEAIGISVRASGADVASMVVGGSVVIAMLVGRRYLPRVPMALLAMVVALIASAALDLQSRGVQVLGPVSPGLPPVGIPLASPGELLGLLPGALGLAILSFADTAATGRVFAAKRGERTDANRELVALAAADAAGGLTGGYPISSSPSRTAAAENAGSSSQMTGLVAAIAVAVVLVLLTGPLSYLPIPALAGVILVSVLGLIDIREIRRIWTLRRSEGAIAFIALAGVILYGTLVGVGIAVLLAALNIVRRAAWPQIIEEGRVADGSWRGFDRRPDARRVAGVTTVRFAGPLFFANATALQARVRELVAARPDTVAVVLDLGATSDIDLTAGGTIRDLASDLARNGRRLAVARPLARVRDELRAYGLAGLMDPTAGTHGSVDEVIIGLGLDPQRPQVLAEPAEEAQAGAAAAAGPAAAGPAAEPPPQPGGGGAPNRLVLRVLGSGLAVIAGAVVLAAVVGASTGGQATGPATVPNLVGLSYDRAATAASDAGFELAAPTYVRRDDRPAGTVVSQDPPAGTEADRGSEILPLVSTTQTLIRVPDVTGEPEAQAIADLAAAGLAVSRAGTAFDPVVAAGSVIATDPAAGASVAAGTAIAYTVSAGPEPGPTTTPAPVATPPPGAVPSAAPTPGASGPAAPTETPSASAEPIPSSDGPTPTSDAAAPTPDATPAP